MKKVPFSILLAILVCLTAAGQKKDTITTASGLRYFLTKKGSGPLVKSGEVAVWHYKLVLTDGTNIEDSRERNAPLGEKVPSDRIVKGVSEALLLMHVGDRGTFILPPSLAYGRGGYAPQGAFPGIPPNATLVFDMELIDIKKAALLDTLSAVLYTEPVRDTSTPHVDEVIALYKDLKKKKVLGNYFTSDNDLNTIGYLVLQKNPQEAIRVFQLNVEEYPKVGNTYDSLGEAYMSVSDFDKAILNYEKAIELDPKNTNAAQMIKRMKEKRAKAVQQM